MCLHLGTGRTVAIGAPAPSEGAENTKSQLARSQVVRTVPNVPTSFGRSQCWLLVGANLTDLLLRIARERRLRRYFFVVVASGGLYVEVKITLNRAIRKSGWT